jgi:folate-binding protein YgfZ
MTLDLRAYQQSLGAQLAPDHIPLHYGDPAREYAAALTHAVIMERSHEGRLRLHGNDHVSLLHRISTNDIESLVDGTALPTIFTNPNGRIIDRVTVFRDGDSTVILTEPGRASAVRDYIQRNIFFNDDAHISDETPLTRQFNLHGSNAPSVLQAAFPALDIPTLFALRRVALDDQVNAVISQLKPIIGTHFVIVVPTEQAVALLTRVLQAGIAHGVTAAGSLTYNALRIRAGRPGVGRELSTDYIPLEVGLWDEVSFSKGCYTGQEIIARMESRRRLAKTLVAVGVGADVDAPAIIYQHDRDIGRLTSSVTAPDGSRYAMGVIKLAAAHAGTPVQIGQARVDAIVGARLGAQPEHLTDDD